MGKRKKRKSPRLSLESPWAEDTSGIQVDLLDPRRKLRQLKAYRELKRGKVKRGRRKKGDNLLF